MYILALNCVPLTLHFGASGFEPAACGAVLLDWTSSAATVSRRAIMVVQVKYPGRFSEPG